MQKMSSAFENLVKRVDGLAEASSNNRPTRNSSTTYRNGRSNERRGATSGDADDRPTGNRNDSNTGNGSRDRNYNRHRSNSRNANNGHGSNQRPTTSGYRDSNRNSRQEPNSENPDFATLSKSLYRTIQLRHHVDNWHEVPVHIVRQIDRVFACIKPPMPDDTLKDDLNCLQMDFTGKLYDIVNRHLRRKISGETATAGLLDRADLDRAKGIADRYARNRLGRLTEVKRKELLENAAMTVGTTRPLINLDPGSTSAARPAALPVRKPTTPPGPVLTTVSTAVPGPAANGTQPTGQSIAPTWKLVTNRRRRSQDSTENATATTSAKRSGWPSTPDAVTTRNRFDLLSFDDDGDETAPIADTPNSATAALPPRQKKLRPSTTTIKNDAGVYLYTCDKEDWCITPVRSDKLIVLADSNFRSVSRVPDEMEIHCMPGASLQHAAMALRRLKSTTPLSIGIQLGINNRFDTEEQIDDQIKQLSSALDSLDCLGEVFAVGVSLPASLPVDAREALLYFNEQMVLTFGPEHWVSPLDTKEVRIRVDDKFGIHYTSETADKIVNNLDQFAHPLLSVF